jgi:hypothetical protein
MRPCGQVRLSLCAWIGVVASSAALALVSCGEPAQTEMPPRLTPPSNLIVQVGMPTEVAHIVSALALDPAAPATLYAGTRSGGVFKSTDGGGSWEAVATGPRETILR